MIKEIESLPDVSFIDNLQLEDVELQMIKDYQDRYKEITGEDVVLSRADPEALILYACAIQIFQELLYVDRAGKQDLLKYSYGTYLDNLAAMKGIAREPAKAAKAKIRFTLSGLRTESVSIAAGTRVTDGEVYFETLNYAEILAGEESVDVLCQCLTEGKTGNNLPVGTIRVLVDPIPYVATVANTEITSGGTDIEDDDSLRERVYIAPSKYSVAGPEGAYEYWVKTYNSSISDVLVYSEDVGSAPYAVQIEFIMAGGELPNESMIMGLQDFLYNEQIRPLTDKVIVKAPDTVGYKIDVKYFVNRSDSGKSSTIQAEVGAAIDEFISWQRSKIGRDINPSRLVQMMVAAGAKRVEVTYPIFQTIGKSNVAKLISKNVSYGGIEDD
ncbi:MAG: baseplate J/gp47 family protein [Lachnospiraceae bacterium]|jgi:phage-related baseplate assembly protein